ncbi:MAG: hypothetical protein LBN22_08730 [Clostridiales Family XIII bacterium]|jgi:hypothetical protein|nr:hypothetical protein [Clostridiales Family XIII bacterium]
MIVKQISVFLENKPGSIEELTNDTGKAGINIEALTIAETAEFGIVRMIVDDWEHARDALDPEYQIRVTDVIRVAPKDEPGKLSEVLRKLSESGINVSYMYGYAKGDQPYLIMKVSDPEKAATLIAQDVQ